MTRTDVLTILTGLRKTDPRARALVLFACRFVIYFVLFVHIVFTSFLVVLLLGDLTIR